MNRRFWKENSMGKKVMEPVETDLQEETEETIAK